MVNLCAANVYEPEDLNVAENMEILQNVHMIYIESFFITHSYEVALKLLRLCKDRKTPLIFSIGSVYIFNGFADKVITLSQRANIVVGNKEEFLELGKALGIHRASVKDTAMALHRMSGEQFEFRDHPLGERLKQLGKVFVVTDGGGPVTCVYGNVGSKPTVVEYNIAPMNKGLIKDTTGAGDSFLAGFLAGLFLLNDTETCLAWGCWTAQQVIQLIGCQIPSCQPNDILKIKC